MAVNAVAIAILSGRFPTDEEAAIHKSRHRRILLASLGLCIDPELTTDLDTLAVVKLAIDAVAAAVLHARPGYDKARIRPGQAGDVVHLLVAGNLCIGQELTADLVAVLIKYLTLNVVTAAVIAGGVVFPGNDEAAAVQAGNLRLIT